VRETAGTSHPKMGGAQDGLFTGKKETWTTTKPRNNWGQRRKKSRGKHLLCTRGGIVPFRLTKKWGIRPKTRPLTTSIKRFGIGSSKKGGKSTNKAKMGLGSISKNPNNGENKKRKKKKDDREKNTFRGKKKVKKKHRECYGQGEEDKKKKH